jgi:hypothetical protein
MNIVQNDETEDKVKRSNNDNSFSSNPDEEHDAAGAEEGEYDQEDDDENSIDDMLEKPIDMLDDKDQCNFYTYNKIQIKKYVLAWMPGHNFARRLGSSNACMRHAVVSQ